MSSEVRVMLHKVLGKALSLVLDHKNELDNDLYAGVHFKVLGIRMGDDSRENLKKWFILALGPGWRAGPVPSLEKRQEAIREFDKWYDDVKLRILNKYSEQRALDEMYKTIDKIPTIGPKTAGVLLRDWIYHFKIWSELKNYLYLPIDRHVRNIIVNKLKAGEEIEVPKVGEDYLKDRNQDFQKELDEIHKPRVEFDYFWTIGNKFCSYNLCDICWLNSLCKQKETSYLYI